MTATPEPDDEVTVPDESPLDEELLDDVLEEVLDEVEPFVVVVVVEAVEPLDVEAVAVVLDDAEVPGIVAALTRPSAPTAARAPTAMPAVNRLSVEIARSRAWIMACPALVVCMPQGWRATLNQTCGEP